METTTYKAVIKSAPSKVMSKSNGAEYVLMNVELADGPAAGHIVAGTRTIKNGAGDEKSCPEIGDEVTVYHTYMESTVDEGEFVHFFEISTGLPQTDNKTLSALFGIAKPVGQSI